MLIAGLQKTSLIDFPAKISALVFTQGCNFTCPYCHNPDLVLGKQNLLELTSIFEFLTQRKNLLEGLVISGGEPTLHQDLFDFCKQVKALGYAIKLDTNGSKPEVLLSLLQAKLLDYVAMDIKADPTDYPQEICHTNISKSILQSIEILEKAAIEHEFRIPCAEPFITKHSFNAIIKYIKHAPIFLQKIRLDNILQADFFLNKGKILTEAEIKELQDLAQNKRLICNIR